MITILVILTKSEKYIYKKDLVNQLNMILYKHNLKNLASFCWIIYLFHLFFFFLINLCSILLSFFFSFKKKNLTP
jgi:hypothetical protein